MAESNGAQLSQLARLLFDRAAFRWYLSIGVEVVVSVMSALLAVVAIGPTIAPLATLAMLTLLSIAYALRVLAEDAHSTAETMRRQSVLAEGLDWKVERVQLDDWRRKAGASLLKRAAANPRPDAFYATQKTVGPRRLAEMTLESAFWTRHLYLAIRGVLLAALLVLGIVITVVVYLALAEPPIGTFGVVVAHVVATVVLVAIGVDVVGWLLRLTRQTDSLKDLERGFDRLLEQSSIDTPEVLRLVSEYDCVLAGSTPILPMVFRFRHDEIQQLWDHRVQDQTGEVAVGESPADGPEGT